MADIIEYQSLLEQYNHAPTQHHTSAASLEGELKGGFNVMSMNIRSIQKHFNELTLLLHSLDELVDVVVLTETWSDGNTNIPHKDGYCVFSTHRSVNRADGVVVYVRERLQPSTIEYTITDSNCVRIDVTDGGRLYTLICVYRSPSVADTLPFIHSLTQHISHNKYTNRVIVIGDININISNSPTKHHQADDYLNSMIRCGFRSCIDIPTRVTQDTESCIDHIFVNFNSDKKFTTMTLENTITDHFPIFIHIPNLPIQTYNKNITQLGHSINYTQIKQHLKNEKWYTVYNSQHPNTSYSYFHEILTKHIQNNTNTYRLRKKVKPIKPWITRALIEAIQRRNQMNLKRKQQPENLDLTQQYKSYRNTLTILIQHTKNTYYRTQIHSAGRSMRKIWEVVRQATDGKARIKDEITEITTNFESVRINDNPGKVADIFNTHFATIGSKMAQHLLSTQNKTLQHILHNYTPHTTVQHSFFLNPVTEGEVITTINSLNTNSASGSDGINNTLLKDIKNFIAKPLTHIINQSFRLGYFPDQLKQSTIIPLFKSGDRKTLANYRPISLTSNIAKVFEKAMKNRLVKYLEKFNLISCNQYGFRRARGTHDALFELTKYITSALDEGDKCIAVFLDLAKAFDTVSHDLLLKKLESVGVRGIAHNWFNTYLTNRTQTVKIDNHVSGRAVIEYGVPQGTILGPILYLIYANDLCNLSVEGRLISFADDTALLLRADTWDEAFRMAESEISLIQSWLNINLLTLNIDKTSFLTFSLTETTKPSNKTLTIHTCSHNQMCDCPKIKQSNEIKYLGLIVDDRLHWDKHTSQLTLRLRKLIYKFVQLRRVLPQDILKSVYYALVESTLSYGILVWGGTNYIYIYFFSR